MEISFNKSPVTPNSETYISRALSMKTSGDGEFTRMCTSWLEKRFSVSKILLTTSGSHSLDIAAWLCDLKEGDEVIMSSFTFPSTANAFVGCGAKIVFVDIRPDTMNIDETLIEAAITEKTRAIVPMHYAGVSCEMDKIINIAEKNNLLIIEDAAQSIMSEYKGKTSGTFGNFGCFSFHETKNFSMGEGGALLIRDLSNVAKAEIIREKGTDRSRFFRGEIDKYSWVDRGSSYLPSEINAAYLWSQLEMADEIISSRINAWNLYYKLLSPLAEKNYIKLPFVPKECRHNAHLFYIKTATVKIQTDLLLYLKSRGIGAVFHYVPLHNSKAGKKFGRFFGEDIFTTEESLKLIRLPLYYRLKESDINYIADIITKFYDKINLN